MSEVMPETTSKRSIFSELMLLLTLISVPFALGIGWYLFSNFNQLTSQQYMQALENLAEEKAGTINQYIDDHSGRVETLSMLPITQLALPAFTVAFQQGGADSTLYTQTQVKYSAFFERYLSHWRYYDLFLIDADGNIIYTVKHESDFTTNLQSGPYRDTGLGQVFKQAINMLQTNNSTFSYYEPSQEAGAFVATPVVSDGKAIGVIALQFDTEAFYHVINDLTGLGESGEVVVGQAIDDRILLTAPLRHDPDAAFQRTIALDVANALPIREGSQGGTGSGMIVDWRGEEVLAVWQYIPALKWGMVVKIDRQEAFAKWQHFERNLIGYVGLSMLIVYLLFYLFTRRITRPLQQLTRASIDFSSGKQDVQIDALLGINNETGVLAKAFDSMLHQVQQSKAKLEMHIEQLAENNRTLDQRVAQQTEHIQAILKYAVDGIITMDQQGDIESVNPALCQMFDYSQAELIGQAMTMLMPEKYRKHHLQGLEQYAGTEHSSLLNISIELEGLRKSAEVFSIDLNISEMRVGDNTLFLGRIRDITEENIKREKLEHTQRLESLGVLAGGIAHDFNNLLTAILGNAALARGKLDKKSPAIELLSNIEKSSERAAALCNQMLAYSGKGQFIVEPLNLTNTVEEMVNLLEVSIEKNVVMRMDLSEQLPLVDADAAQMQQVIMNLVINASEAIEHKSGIITIHTGMIAVDDQYIQTSYMDDELKPGRYVVMEVSDTGCGMTDDVKKHLFDPFFTTKFTGRGLGMSAILGIVRGHHGAIKVYSEEGKGTTFKILLPCSAVTQIEPEISVNVAVQLQGQGTVLIVDDEETIREVASMMLEHIGFSILTAKDGKEGVEMFRQHQADISVVLLDMTMPRMNGEEVFREIRSIQPDVKVILSSGYNEQDATHRFAGKGLSGFIQKPYLPDALQAMVVDIL